LAKTVKIAKFERFWIRHLGVLSGVLQAGIDRERYWYSRRTRFQIIPFVFEGDKYPILKRYYQEMGNTTNEINERK
jgi:hypothetical protein